MQTTLLDLQAFLRRLLLSDKITLQQANDLEWRWLHGERFDVPLAPQQVFAGNTNEQDDRRALLLLLALWMGRRAAANTLRKPGAAFDAIDDLRLSAMMNQHEALQNQFESQTEHLAKTPEKKDVGTWQRWLWLAIIGHTLGQWFLGTGKPLSPQQRQTMDEALRTQAAYLTRFADTVALQKANGKPMSPVAIAHRAKLYGNNGRAQFYQGHEAKLLEGSREARQLDETDSLFGIVEQYITMDDGGVCPPCKGAGRYNGGYYLPGTGPWPGEVCLGNCRCRRVKRNLPDEYRRLKGMP